MKTLTGKRVCMKGHVSWEPPLILQFCPSLPCFDEVVYFPPHTFSYMDWHMGRERSMDFWSYPLPVLIEQLLEEKDTASRLCNFLGGDITAIIVSTNESVWLLIFIYSFPRTYRSFPQRLFILTLLLHSLSVRGSNLASAEKTDYR